MRCLRLPFTFDPEKLRADLALVRDDEWIPHLNHHVYEGDWSGAALRAIGGDGTNIVPEAIRGGRFADTPLRQRCVYFSDVLAAFRCPLRAVRLLRLRAGSHVGEHVDHGLDFEDGEVRLHVPIITSDEVRFFLDGTHLAMAPGECWYTNVNLPHSVENSGTIDRVHLVIDCQVDDWLRDVFARTPPVQSGAYSGGFTSATAIEAYRLFVSCHHVAAQLEGTPRCTTSPREIILCWRDTHSWQIRLAVVDRGETWSARLETSPDPEGRFARRLDAFVSSLTAELPGLSFEREPGP